MRAGTKTLAVYALNRVASNQYWNVTNDIKSTTTSAPFLCGWALDRSIGTEDAEITRFRAKDCFAVHAFVVELADIGWHGFLPNRTAMRAGQDGFDNDATHDCLIMNGGWIICIGAGWLFPAPPYWFYPDPISHWRSCAQNQSWPQRHPHHPHPK